MRVTDGNAVAGASIDTGAPRRRLVEAYRDWVEPTVSGLPNWRVVTWFPALVTLGAIILIALHISGTSSGAHWANFGVGEDPNALLGSPRLIRTDEWLVSQSWVISQYEQGFPVYNQTLPGGMDATVLNELPTWDWSTLFRPHEWGYLLFGLDVGIAWQWWVPAIGLVSGAYLLVVSLLPRRAITAAVIACAVFFSPIFQWWYGPNALWPAAWSLLAMAAVVWMIKDHRRWVRIVWAAVLGWLAVTMAIGLYVPFILPSVLVFVFFFIGMVLQERPWQKGVLKPLVGKLVPLVVAGAFAGVMVLLWFRTRAATIEAVTSTVYPGQRSIPSGQLLSIDPWLAAFAGAPFGQTFTTGSVVLGPNPSEAATAILLSIFLLPALAWLVVRGYRRDGRLDWVIIASGAGLLLVLAFLFIPGWDAVARLLLLDKVPVTRFRMGFAVMLPLFFALVAREVDRNPAARTWPLALLSGLVALASIVTTAVSIALVDPETYLSSPLWPVAAVGILGGVVLVFFPRTIPWAAVGLLVASLAIGAAVNPLYRGAFNLNDTQIGQEIHVVEDENPGTWVGVGSYEVMALMMQSGVEAYNGVQPYPPEEMWEEIDPDGGDEQVWNRLAHVRWTWGDGEPTMAVPFQDAIQLTFDACSDFAQEHVDYVLSDEAPLADSCLVEIADEQQGKTDMQIYRVVAP